MALAHAPARCSACAPASTPRSSRARAGWSARAPASRCSRTRRSSAPTPSRTSRASTRTACSSTRRPTRSCGPRPSAPARRCSCSASTRGAHALRARGSRELGYALEGEALRRGVRALQGAGRQEEARSPTPTWRRSSPPSSRRRREFFALDGLQVALRHDAACRRRPCACAAPTAQIRTSRPRSAPARSTRPSRRSTRSCSAPATLLEYSRARGDRGHRRARRGERAHPRGERAEAASTRSTAPTPRIFHGHGADTDIIVASAKAYLAALNRMLAATLGYVPRKRARLTPTRRRPARRRRMSRASHDMPQTLFEKIWDDARRRARSRRARRSSTSICTWSTRSPRRRRSRACARAGSRCAGPTGRSRRWITRPRR